ncbi:hypothetical protein Tco_0758194 [Tanacetum coccineum]
MFKKFSLEDSKLMKTPMSSDTKLTKDEECESVDSTKYRVMIGSLLYQTASSPDIMFSVCFCALFQEDHKTSHLEEQNKSLAIAGRNLFDAEDPPPKHWEANPPTPPKTLHEHSHPNPTRLMNANRTTRPNILKKQKKDDENEQLLLIFKQIHINLPFLEAMIHMPKGAKESAPKRRGPRKLHASMSYQTPGSQERLG